MTRTVLFVAHTGQISGAERVLLRLADLARSDGHRVMIACPPGPLAEVLPAGSTHLPIPALGLVGEHGIARTLAAARLLLRWWSASRSLSRVVRDRNTDVVVNSMFALPTLRLARPPVGVAWLVHDTMTTAKQRAVTRLGAPAVRSAVAVSEATAAPLRAAGLPVSVAHNGVHWPVPRLGDPLHRPPVVGMLALLTPWKGHRVLLDAAGTLPAIEVELAGAGFPGDAGYIAELRERSHRPDLAGRVRFLGHQDAETAMRRWDVLVSASTSPEAGPLGVLEAMAAGLPVIGTDHGGTTEFLRDGAGVLVPPGDADALAKAIERVLADATLRDNLADRARRRIAEEHDIADTLPSMLAALLTTAHRRSSTP